MADATPPEPCPPWRKPLVPRTRLPTNPGSVSGDPLEAIDFLYARSAWLVEIRGNRFAFRLDLGSAYVLHPGDCTNWNRNYYEPESACDSVVAGDSVNLTLSYILR